MIPKINHYIGRTIIVSIPSLFSDGAGRPYTLLGFELAGLWLQSDELNQRLLADDMRDLAEAAPIVFVPFSQIAGVLVPTVNTAAPPPAPPPPAGSSRDRPAARRTRRSSGQPRTRQARGKGKASPPQTET
jgi:hypothetical protein